MESTCLNLDNILVLMPRDHWLAPDIPKLTLLRPYFGPRQRAITMLVSQRNPLEIELFVSLLGETIYFDSLKNWPFRTLSDMVF